MKFKSLLAIGLLAVCSQSFALNESLSSLSDADKEELEAFCEMKSTDATRATRLQNARKFANFMKEMQTKYPDVVFSQPCV